MSKPNCYDCEHRRTIPGDCHSSCANTLAKVTGEKHGIKNGWFNWPFNFDPNWLTSCDGFKKTIRSFDHPNMENFLCPVCGTKADAPVVLVPIPGTEDGNIMQAKQVHKDCYLLVEKMQHKETYGTDRDTPKYLEVKAAVRYWEGAEVNGVEDKDGSLIPFRKGDDWCPIIDLDAGKFIDWPEDIAAKTYYKVCDAGEYWLLNAERERILKWNGDYVPNNFLCFGDNGYGDYIIINTKSDGSIINYKKPEIIDSEWVSCD
jgi:hypothetical protein